MTGGGYAYKPPSRERGPTETVPQQQEEQGEEVGRAMQLANERMRNLIGSYSLNEKEPGLANGVLPAVRAWYLIIL